MGMRINRLVLVLLPLLFPPGTPAGDGTGAALTYDRVSLSFTAVREVENDTLVAVLFAQREGGDSARLSAEVNRLVAQAVERSKQVEGVKVQTLDYQTSPVYQQQSVVGWRVRQSLRLESLDAARLGALVGELQADLAVQSIGYSVSPGRLAAVEEGLIGEAVAGFERRAGLVAGQLARSGYRLVQMDVDTGGAVAPSPMMFRGAPMAMAAEAMPPTLEAGTRSMAVTVRGTVELQRP